MAEATPSPAHDDAPRDSNKFEIIVASLLGLAALLTAFAAYRGEIHSGDSIKAYQEGIRSVSDANQQFVEGNQQYAFDSQLFLEFVKATQADDVDLATYLQDDLMEEPLKSSLKEWSDMGDDGPATPLLLDSYVPEAYVQAVKLEEQTAQKFELARTEDDIGDKWVLVTVFLASSLFLLGIAGVGRVRTIRIGSLAAGSLVLLVSMIYAVTI